MRAANLSLPIGGTHKSKNLVADWVRAPFALWGSVVALYVRCRNTFSEPYCWDREE
jgi:hypothetical protein